MIEPDGLATRFAAIAYYCGPVAPQLEPNAMITTDENRWNATGEPTIYLAGDMGVALAEFARHVPPDGAIEAQVWAVDVDLTAVIDLRRHDASSRLGVADDPRWYLDGGRCRSLASRLRAAQGCDGMIVLSVAMLDQGTRWNAVVFLDRLRQPLPAAVRPRSPVARIGHARAVAAGTARREDRD